MKPINNPLRFFLRKCWLALAVLICSYSLPSMAAEQSTVAEYKLKAALIYRLTGFIQWPQTNRATDSKEFGICILGRDDFGDALDSLEQKLVGETPISIKRFSQSASINTQCQIVFISESKAPFLDDISRALMQYPILTLGDSDNFAKKGGMLQFTQGERRISFTINLNNAKAVGLKMAAPLLKLSTIVESNTKDGAR